MEPDGIVEIFAQETPTGVKRIFAEGNANLDIDGAPATDTSSQSVTVTEPSTSGIALSATGYKVRGRQHVDLEWIGRSTGSMEIVRDGSTITTISNDPSGTTTYTDSTGKNGGGTYTYQVCDEGTTTCSNVVTVTF